MGSKFKETIRCSVCNGWIPDDPLTKTIFFKNRTCSRKCARISQSAKLLGEAIVDALKPLIKGAVEKRK